MTARLHLCVNCLGPDARPVPVGGHRGSPYADEETLDLCEACRGDLVNGDLDLFHSRYLGRRSVTRKDVEPK